MITTVVVTISDDLLEHALGATTGEWALYSISSNREFIVAHPEGASSCLQSLERRETKVQIHLCVHCGDYERVLDLCNACEMLRERCQTFHHLTHDRLWRDGLKPTMIALEMKRPVPDEIWERLIFIIEDLEGRTYGAAESLLGHLQAGVWSFEVASSKGPLTEAGYQNSRDDLLRALDELSCEESQADQVSELAAAAWAAVTTLSNKPGDEQCVQLAVEACAALSRFLLGTDESRGLIARAVSDR